jgi:hypothetical protein
VFVQYWAYSALTGAVVNIEKKTLETIKELDLFIVQ